MRFLSRLSTALLLAGVAAACTDEPTSTPPVEQPKPPAPEPIGVYAINITGLGTPEAHADVKADGPPLSGGVRGSMTNAGAGLVFEQISAATFIEGTRGQGGQRFGAFTFRVRNGTGVSLNNVSLVLVSKATTIAGTPIFNLRKFDGTAADPSIAPLIVPTGAAVLGSDQVTMQALYPDVLQVFTEAEVAAITVPGDVTGVFPYAFMVRSTLSNSNRTLPATADPNQFDGVFTIAFRMPLQASSTQDVFSLGFQILAVTDTETRLTESIEEAQDTAAVRRLRDRATSLGATTVTVLNGSPVMDPAVPDYSGQRQICSPRTAGPSGSPTTTIVSPGAYSELMILRPSETLDPCAAYFRGGSPQRPATNVPYTLTIKAMDRYGNVKTSQVDSIHMVAATGPPVTVGGVTALVSGSTDQVVTYTDYGVSGIFAVGRRLKDQYFINVAGVTRTWTAGAGTTDWNTNLNWSPAAVPMSLDSVYVPVAAPLDPTLASNVQVLGVTVEDVATLNLGAFNLTAGDGNAAHGANVTAGLTGGITNTSGQLILAGIASTMQGKLPRIRVTGTYSLTGNVNARAPIQSDAGRITASAFRLQADSN
jgi:hypothetical protein